jgi:hypothetical protein
MAQPRPHHRTGRCRRPARCDLCRFLPRQITDRPLGSGAAQPKHNPAQPQLCLWLPMHMS